MSLATVLKDLVLPRDAAFRRLPWGSAAGVTMKIDFAQQSRLYFGLYELEIAGHVRRLARSGVRCFDVGGDAGYYSLLLANLSRMPVVVFDPDPEAVARMRENFVRNPFPIEIRALAVGARDGEGTITLDTAARQTFAPDFIKIDIEGAEVAALGGAECLLRDRKPHLVIEVHGRDREAACVAILERHGYRPKRIALRRFAREERPAEYNGWLVCEGAPRGANRR
jgi:hypothetical protein